MLADSDHYEKRTACSNFIGAARSSEPGSADCILLTETTSLGVRYYAVHRHINYRKVTIVSLPEGEVRINMHRWMGKL